MPVERVLTYEASGGGAVRIAGHDSLASSSAALPEGAYTTLRTYRRRRLVRFDRHLARLRESVALQGQPAELDAAGARAAVAAVLDATGFPESRLRLTFVPPRLFVAVEAFQPLPRSAYSHGVACVTLELRRENPQAKDTRFIATAQDAYRRLPEGVEEGLLVAEDGSLLEGLSSNFFAVAGGLLRTEAGRALSGVTRSLVIEAAAAVMPLEERAVRKGELQHLEEAFLTSVSREVLPVVRIDGRPVGSGRVGPRTRAVMDRFADLVEREAEVF